MTSERLMHVELENVLLHETKPRAMSTFSASSNIQEDDVETAYGTMRIIVQGDRSKPAIVTYHDIGLNSVSCFQAFFSYPDMQQLLRHFCVYHVNAPGQHENAPSLRLRHSESEKLLQEIVDPALKKRASVGVIHPNTATTLDNFAYPSMDQLAEMLLQVLGRYGLRHAFGFGVGAGANILARFALYHPDKIDGLVLINCTSTHAGWIEWGYQKWNTWYLKSGQMTAGVEDYLLWHWFGPKTNDVSYDLLASYMDYVKSMNAFNLGLFIDSYVRRTDLGITREIDETKKVSTKVFKCPVMMVVGDASAHVDDTVEMNSRMDPTSCTWIKFECSGMVMEEAPGKLCESFLYFLQGLGHVPTLRLKKAGMGSTESLNKVGDVGDGSGNHYQRNSIAEARC